MSGAPPSQLTASAGSVQCLLQIPPTSPRKPQVSNTSWEKPVRVPRAQLTSSINQQAPQPLSLSFPLFQLPIQWDLMKQNKTFHAKLGVSCQLQQKQHYQQTESHHRGNHNDSVYREMFPTGFVSNICGRDLVTSVGGVSDVIRCSPIILN